MNMYGNDYLDVRPSRHITDCGQRCRLWLRHEAKCCIPAWSLTQYARSFNGLLHACLCIVWPYGWDRDSHTKGTQLDELVA